jgi:hypothetical protein
MSLAGSIRAQKLADEILGLDTHNVPLLPQHASYRGKITDFYKAHKQAIMIGGAVAIVLIVGAVVMSSKNKNTTESENA